MLGYVQEKHPLAERVDFIVEQKGVITGDVKEFHSHLSEAMVLIGRSDLAALVGQLIPGDKECIPCQAADVLCWHAARFEDAQKVAPQDVPDARRYLKLRHRKGKWFDLENPLVSEIAAACLKRNPKSEVGR